jgi:hypothetical protein
MFYILNILVVTSFPMKYKISRIMSEIIFCSIQMSKNPFNVLKMYFDKILLDYDDTGLECILTLYFFFLLFRPLVSFFVVKLETSTKTFF